MNSLFTLVYGAAIVTSVVIVVRSNRNRFLPMASPISMVAILLVIICGSQLYDHLSTDTQAVVPNWAHAIKFSLSMLILPIWAHIISEYKYSRKLPITHHAWMYIEPTIAIGLVFSNALYSVENIDFAYEFLGTYRPLHFAYMLLVGSFVLVWSIYTVGRKTRRDLYSLLQFGVSLGLPMVLFLALSTGYLSKPLGASALVLLLVWAAKESNLMDIIPSAISGVLRRINAGVLVFNAQRQLVYQNSLAGQLLEADIDADGSKQKTAKASHADDLPATIRAAFDFDSQQTQSQLLQLPQRRPLNTQSSNEEGDVIHYFDATLSAIKNDKTQQFLGSILVFQDVSERVESELELAQNNQQLEQLDRQKTAFFAGISHEFRTPLTLSIGGLHDALNGDYGEVPKALKSVIGQAKQNNQRLLALVGQLLELSRLNGVEPNQSSALFSPQEISLITVLNNVGANFESLAPKQKTKLKVIDKSSSNQLWFDPSSLEKVIMNLLSNAFKSIQHDGNIDIMLMDDNEKIKLSVKDNGHGISDDVLPHIFKAFYYHDQPQPNWSTGTGIGLYLVKQILETHNATIEVISDEGQGSEFIVTFLKGREHLGVLADRPVLNKHDSDDSSKMNIAVSGYYQADQFSIDAEDSKGALFSPSNSAIETNEPNVEKLVLVVEDNVQMRRYIRHHLAKEFRLIEAEDGDEGFELAKQSVPDLILSDLMMPKTNGLQLTEKIRSTPATSHIPIILLTAKSEPEDKLDGFKLGIDDFITKPFDATQLAARIHNLISSREALRQRFSSHLDSESLASEQESNLLVEQETLFLKQLDAYISRQLDNSDLLIKDIAAEFNMSERSFHRKLNAVIDISPKQYIIKLRMNAAKKILRDTDKAIGVIALSTGFGGLAQFSRAFKRQYQMSPAEYRQQYKKAS